MTSEQEDASTDMPGLEPWGLHQVEQLLSGLDGVQSLKIVPDGHGGIDEVHAVGNSDLGAKQIVRNIESALLAEFGLQVDHRKISIAQVKKPDLSVAENGHAADALIEPATGTRRLILERLEIERKAGTKIACLVALEGEDTIFEGSAEGADFSRSRLEVVGHAVLEALNKATMEDIVLRLEGMSRIEVSGRDLVVAVIQGQEGRRSVTLPGISLVVDSPEDSAVLACLQATNRWAGAT